MGVLEDSWNNVTDALDPSEIWKGPLRDGVPFDDELVKDDKRHLTAILRGGGWPASEVRTAAAVAMAESGGDADVVNPAACSSNDDHAVGLLQVCTINLGAGGGPKEKSAYQDWLKNPDNNARAGHAVFQEQGWGAWATYKSGAYKRFIGQDPLITTKKGTLTDSVSDAVETVTNPLSGIGDVLAKIAEALFDPSTYFRLGKGLLGGILLILGTAAIVFVVANKVSGGKITKAVKSVPVAGAAIS
jgi:hypothetical protein